MIACILVSARPNVPGDVEAVSTANVGIELQHPSSQAQRLLTEIRGRFRLVVQHLHDVPCFKHRADAPAYRLATVGHNHLNEEAELV